jgi:hypothetical protein
MSDEASWLQREIKGLKQAEVELQELNTIASQYKQDTKCEQDEHLHKHTLTPLIISIKCGAYILSGTPEIYISKDLPTSDPGTNFVTEMSESLPEDLLP